jgi:radical SAM superfamily enzyme YgiQ (UPF0313 family)
MGVRLPERRGATAATIIPSVGCPMGCNFCTASSFFGGKGKFHNFYETGDELFDLMEGFENSMKVQPFFVMDGFRARTTWNDGQAHRCNIHRQICA